MELDGYALSAQRICWTVWLVRRFIRHASGCRRAGNGVRRLRHGILQQKHVLECYRYNRFRRRYRFRAPRSDSGRQNCRLLSGNGQLRQPAHSVLYRLGRRRLLQSQNHQTSGRRRRHYDFSVVRFGAEQYGRLFDGQRRQYRRRRHQLYAVNRRSVFNRFCRPARRLRNRNVLFTNRSGRRDVGRVFSVGKQHHQRRLQSAAGFSVRHDADFRHAS